MQKRHLQVTLSEDGRVIRNVVVVTVAGKPVVISLERRGNVMVGSHQIIAPDDFHCVTARLEALATEWHKNPRYSVSVARRLVPQDQTPTS